MQREEFHLDTGVNHLEGSENDRQKLTSGFPRCKINSILSKLCIGLLIVVVLAIIFICVAFVISYENEEQLVATIELHTVDLPPEQSVWFETNLAELRNAFRVPKNNRRAKNVALFVALGMAESSGAQQTPIWESFPHLALLRASQDRWAKFNPTALFCGIETRPNTIGLDAGVEPADECINVEHNYQTHEVASIVQWAQVVGRRTALVTNGEIVMPFPAALYAHTPNESWTFTSPEPTHCPSVQTQLLRSDTGKQLNVIAGSFDCTTPSCKDNFVAAWEGQKMQDDLSYRVSADMNDLLNSGDDSEYVLGLYNQLELKKPGAFQNLTLGALHSVHKSEGFLLVAIADSMKEISLQELDATVRSTMWKLSDTLEDSLIIVLRSSNREGFAAVHATGPMSHLLHRVHNQTYLAHFISYAARTGRFRDSDLANFVLQIF